MKFLLILCVSLFSLGCDESSTNTGNNSNNTNNSSSIPVRTDCTFNIVYNAGSEGSVHLAGNFNEWQIDDDWLLLRDGYTWTISVTSNPHESRPGLIILPAGEYEYKLVSDSTNWHLDSSNPYTIWDKTQINENSLMTLPDCSSATTRELNTTVNWDEKSASMTFQIYRGGDGSNIENVEAILRKDGVEVNSSLNFNPQTGIGTVTASNLVLGKYKVEINVNSENGTTYSRNLSFWMEPEGKVWEDMIMYSIFVDRFYNGDVSNDAPISGLPEQVNWRGGDWKGITQKLKDGFFEDLGITALWLSTPMDNPDYALPGDCGQSFSGYHAYWPQAARDVENHFGTIEDLQELVYEAHARGIRVLVDWAANHIFIDHPLHEQYYGNQFWFNYPGSINTDEFWKNKCGHLGWNEYALTCWFTEYLPDYNHKNHLLLRQLIDDAMWWVDTFDLDGFRVDATKHINSNYLRLLRRELDQKASSITAPFYMVGENFLYDYGIINEKISSSELQGQFDFPMYGAIRTALIGAVSNLLDLNTFIYENHINRQNITDLDWALEGSISTGTLMGTFLGNHDVERFSSVAAGQANGDGCQAFNEALVPQTGDATVYQRMGVAFGFLLTVRGLPVIYYGDEFGLAGVKDPDNRRMMDFSDTNLSDAQRNLKDLVSRLNHARNTYKALRTGSYDAGHGSASCLAYLKKLGNERLLVVLGGNDGCNTQIEMKSSWGISDGTTLADVLYETDTLSVSSGQVNVSLPPWSVRIYAVP
ncbi:hypothetical protein KKF34_17790 [Myxococcota bacterium]|nr:hypothetical protein [Myxococcota bacterium]MBU1382174.1 hypothetical protein [Myxococcota bacterium]MBU1498736.1 hypothetical protein [Myxococcota bacterium]